MRASPGVTRWMWDGSCHSRPSGRGVIPGRAAEGREGKGTHLSRIASWTPFPRLALRAPPGVTRWVREGSRRPGARQEVEHDLDNKTGRWGNDQPQSTFTPCIEIVFRSVDVVASIFHLGYSRGGPLWRGAISALESRIHGNAVQFLGINPAMRESMESEFAG